MHTDSIVFQAHSIQDIQQETSAFLSRYGTQPEVWLFEDLAKQAGKVGYGQAVGLQVTQLTDTYILGLQRTWHGFTFPVRILGDQTRQEAWKDLWNEGIHVTFKTPGTGEAPPTMQLRDRRGS
jgi:hypothetical protein